MEDPSRRGRPMGRWKDMVKVHVCESSADRGRGIEQPRRECIDRERWRLLCCDHPTVTIA